MIGYKLVFGWLMCAVLACAVGRAEVAPGIKVGESGPGFVLPDVKGKSMRLEDYRGKPVVLNFWAFWCDTWKAELPHLKELATRQDEIGFHLVAISVDGTRQREFQRVTGGKVPFPVLLDVGGKVSADYRIGHVPTVVILDGAGKVCYTHVGYPGNEAVLHAVRKILAERVAATQPASGEAPAP